MNVKLNVSYKIDFLLENIFEINSPQYIDLVKNVQLLFV